MDFLGLLKPFRTAASVRSLTSSTSTVKTEYLQIRNLFLVIVIVIVNLYSAFMWSHPNALWTLLRSACCKGYKHTTISLSYSKSSGTITFQDRITGKCSLPLVVFGRECILQKRFLLAVSEDRFARLRARKNYSCWNENNNNSLSLCELDLDRQTDRQLHRYNSNHEEEAAKPVTCEQLMHHAVASPSVDRLNSLKQ